MVLKLKQVKANKLIVNAIRWDLKPEDIFKERFTGQTQDPKILASLNGYMFYIDHVGKTTQLSLLRTNNLISDSFAEIEDAPMELLMNAVKKEGVKDIRGMYPIDNLLEAYLKHELGIG